MRDDDDYRVTSELYRLMPPRKRAGSGDLGEALAAAHVTGPELREALDAANGPAPAAADAADDFSWADAPPSRQRRWPRRLVRSLARVDVWILIVTAVGVVIAYLTLVKPR
jgi:hypothetical protein